jgi:hypothetical protein
MREFTILDSITIICKKRRYNKSIIRILLAACEECMWVLQKEWRGDLGQPFAFLFSL